MASIFGEGDRRRLDANAGAWMTVINDKTGHPFCLSDDENQLCRIHLAGSESDAYQRIVEENGEAMRRRFEVTRKLTLSTAELREQQINLAVACTLGWENFFDDGQLLPPTPTIVRRVYQANYIWLVQTQIIPFIENGANYGAKKLRPLTIPPEDIVITSPKSEAELLAAMGNT